MSETTVKQIDDFYRSLGERASTGERQPTPIRFLLIDDDDDFHLVMKSDFARRGLILDSALTAGEGLRKAVSQNPPYTLIVLDVKGIGERASDTFAKLLRDAPGSPVAICTGYPADEEVMACAKHGPFWLLEKPLDVGRLSTIFEHYRAMLAPQTT